MDREAVRRRVRERAIEMAVFTVAAAREFSLETGHESRRFLLLVCVCGEREIERERDRERERERKRERAKEGGREGGRERACV